MIIKCPNCNAALEYEPIANKMVCKFCDSSFDVMDFEDGVYVGPEFKQKKKEEEERRKAAEEKLQAQMADDPLYAKIHPTPVQQKYKTNDGSLKTENPFWMPNVKTVTTSTGTKVKEFDPELELDDDMMECNIFTCTTCGAELAVNGVESSTFCAYCGQPTIVFNRVSKTLKPEYIIPFTITRERALEIIRKRLKKGLFIPKEIKNFEVERLRGIYIPYWLIDARYYDDQIWKGTVKQGKSSKTVYFNRCAEVEFTGLTMDASRNLNDNSSQKLEPFDLRAKKTFEIGYMQGFYADRYDVGRTEIRKVAMKRIKELFDREVEKTISASNRLIVQNSPEFELRKATYAMLPAWFLTFRYNGVAHTLLVNGQTGKIVGGLPFKWLNVILSSGIISLISMIFMFPFVDATFKILYKSHSSDSWKGFAVVILIFAVLYIIALNNFRKVRASEKLTKEAEMNRFVKERQEDNNL